MLNFLGGLLLVSACGLLLAGMSWLTLLIVLNIRQMWKKRDELRQFRY